MKLVVYGDFNCPFSALASSRVARLEQAGDAHVDWRAVAHDIEIPAQGERVQGTNAQAYQAELDQVHGLLLPDERLTLGLPAVRSSTIAATDAYAGTAPRSRSRVRVELFRAYWEQGTDIGDPVVLSTHGLKRRNPALAAEWRSEWLHLDRPLVPMMRLPDGYVSRGLGVLARLSELIADAAA
jgi:predicted DsbA family dithiol-disulfide isomerase